MVLGGFSSLIIVTNSYAVPTFQDFTITFDFVDLTSINNYGGFSSFSSVVVGGSANGSIVYDADVNNYFTNSATGESYIGPVDVTLNLGNTYTEIDDIDYSVIPTAPDVTLINDVFSSLLFIVASTDLDSSFSPIWEFSIDGDVFELGDTRESDYDLLATGNVSYVEVAVDTTPPYAAIPVPATIWLISIGGLAGLMVGPRNRKQKGKSLIVT